MVRLTEKLVKKGFAYEKLRSLYFDISRFSDYGKLSGVDLEKIRLGATVDLDDYEKDNPRDFTLLKRSKLSEMKRGLFTRTPWGNVRPSWHLQCAALAMKYLGEQYDIQASGRELIFPHHENKIAIAGAVNGKSPARFWVHCEGVQGNGNRDSLNDTGLSFGELLDMGYSGKEIRYWLMASHYRKPLNFSTDRLDDARKSLKRLNTCVGALMSISPDRTPGTPYPDLNQLVYDIKNGFVAAMDDDLNMSAAMASVFKNVKAINILCQEEQIDPAGAAKLFGALKKIDTVLNVFDFTPTQSTPEIQTLIAGRAKARADGNWAEADAIRDRLRGMGVVVMDPKLT